MCYDMDDVIDEMYAHCERLGITPEEYSKQVQERIFKSGE